MKSREENLKYIINHQIEFFQLKNKFDGECLGMLTIDEFWQSYSQIDRQDLTIKDYITATFKPNGISK